MTINEANDYIKELENASYEPSHDNSVRLMSYMNNFQNDMPVIHVAGTNGKGSTIRLIKEILIAAGLSVGTFMSPHIYDYTELVEDNGITVTNNDFAKAVAVVKEVCQRIVNDGYPHPTAFECLTAASLNHLAHQNHDCILVEVGLGGKDDATNVFESPMLSIITPISYDHEAVLGDTIEEIAKHKAGIIKKGSPVVLAPNNIETISVVTERVKELDTYLYLLDEGLIHTNTFVKNNTNKIFSIKTPFFEYRNLHTTMFGRHQEINIATALLAVKQLKKHFDITDDAIRTGIKNTTWSCRNELLCVQPLILLDGGHNPAGTEALRELIANHYNASQVITVFGVNRDKNYQAMIQSVEQFSDRIILTKPDSDRALEPEIIELSGNVSAEIEPSIEKALTLALTLANESDLIVVTGSLYLAHPAKIWLTQKLEL